MICAKKLHMVRTLGGNHHGEVPSGVARCTLAFSCQGWGVGGILLPTVSQTVWVGTSCEVEAEHP